MRINSIWKKKVVGIAVVSALVFAMIGCGNTPTGAASSETVEEETEEEAQPEEAQETEESIETETIIEEETTDEAEEIVAEGSTEVAAEKELPKADISNVKIDYKTSEIYTKEDMDAAIDKILDEFSGWDGCVLYDISYTDDEKCEENLGYIQSLDTDHTYDQCIVFVSNFHSPVEEAGAWEPDYDYENWEWYLGRAENGEWELLTWGY